MNKAMSPSGTFSVVTEPLGADEFVASDPIAVSSDLVTLTDPGGLAAESIRQLRTRIIAQHLERGRRALAFCAPAAESGCSFVAANTAVAFAQIGIRVLFINADMRSSDSGTLFGEGREGGGLFDYLARGAKAQLPIEPFDAAPGLSLVRCGGTAANAQELLSATRFSGLLSSCLREFDLTIIDTPPANLYADAQRIAALAGYAVIVGRSNTTYFNDVSVLGRQLKADGVTVVGTILNEY